MAKSARMGLMFMRPKITACRLPEGYGFCHKGAERTCGRAALAKIAAKDG
jgi:hypothetical protein